MGRNAYTNTLGDLAITVIYAHHAHAHMHVYIYRHILFMYGVCLQRKSFNTHNTRIYIFTDNVCMMSLGGRPADVITEH